MIQESREVVPIPSTRKKRKLEYDATKARKKGKRTEVVKDEIREEEGGISRE